MIDEKKIIELLSTSVYAPSGDNSQPWRFEIKDSYIYIFSEPEKDNPKFNFRKRGTLLAHGALIENILILGPTLGLKLAVEYFPEGKNTDCTARIRFELGELKTDPLSEFIKLRSTNRKTYSNRQISEAQKIELVKSAEETGDGRVIFTENDNDKTILGQAISVNEIVMLEDHELHDLFFKDVRWNKIDEQKYKTGLYLKTMELDKPKEIAFKLLKSWPIAKMLTRLGVAKFIAKENAKIYSSGGVIGAVIIPDEDQKFIQAGRITQRIWLKSTMSKLSFHPMTGIIYLAQRLKANALEGFSTDHIEQIRMAYSKIANIFEPKNQEVIAMLFRLGYSDPVSAMSSKQKPKIKFVNTQWI